MRRTAALQPLSREHHVALEHSRRRRSEAEVAAVVASFLAFFVVDGERHFRAEEEVLLPLVPADEEPAGRRLSRDHAEIRRLARSLGERSDCAIAGQLGELLAAHVRFDERELFPLLEARLDREALADVGRRLDDAEHGGH